MAFKVNYGLQKAERDRAKKAKKEAKAREREAGVQPSPDQDDPEASQDASDPADATGATS